jgi:hypothetical protein
MYNVDVFRLYDNCANIEQLPIKRDWMEKTFDKHAYNCFPMTLTNGLGWGISFPKDIVFKWDGINSSDRGHVELIEGHEYAYVERENASISFKTGLMFITDENTSILIMPIPNMFIYGIEMFTTLISTSFFKGQIPCAARITKPNEEIVLKANTPIMSLIPISLSYLQNSKINLYNSNQIPKEYITSLENGNEYSQSIEKINKEGKWSNFYREAINHKGQKIGNHEVKAIRLETIKNYE